MSHEYLLLLQIGKVPNRGAYFIQNMPYKCRPDIYIGYCGEIVLKINDDEIVWNKDTAITYQPYNTMTIEGSGKVLCLYVNTEKMRELRDNKIPYIPNPFYPRLDERVNGFSSTITVEEKKLWINYPCFIGMREKDLINTSLIRCKLGKSEVSIFPDWVLQRVKKDDNGIYLIPLPPKKGMITFEKKGSILLYIHRLHDHGDEKSYRVFTLSKGYITNPIDKFSLFNIKNIMRVFLSPTKTLDFFIPRLSDEGKNSFEEGDLLRKTVNSFLPRYDPSVVEAHLSVCGNIYYPFNNDYDLFLGERNEGPSAVFHPLSVSYLYGKGTNDIDIQSDYLSTFGGGNNLTLEVKWKKTGYVTFYVEHIISIVQAP